METVSRKNYHANEKYGKWKKKKKRLGREDKINLSFSPQFLYLPIISRPGSRLKTDHKFTSENLLELLGFMRAADYKFSFTHLRGE